MYSHQKTLHDKNDKSPLKMDFYRYFLHYTLRYSQNGYKYQLFYSED